MVSVSSWSAKLVAARVYKKEDKKRYLYAILLSDQTTNCIQHRREQEQTWAGRPLLLLCRASRSWLKRSPTTSFWFISSISSSRWPRLPIKAIYCKINKDRTDLSHSNFCHCLIIVQNISYPLPLPPVHGKSVQFATWDGLWIRWRQCIYGHQHTKSHLHERWVSSPPSEHFLLSTNLL